MLRRPIELAASAALTAVCCAAAWLAVASYRVDLDAEAALSNGQRPSATALARAAEQRIGAAVEALADTAAEPSKRLVSYRAHLEAADTLLVASLRVRPVDTLGWVRLAAVVWELADHADENGRQAALMAGAETLAPGRADVHQGLAELSLDMGRTSAGCEQLRRAIALDESLARSAIAALSRRGFEPAEIAALVPPRPRHLVALAKVYFDEDQESEYIELVEPFLESEPDAQLLASWANAYRRLGEWTRLENALGSLAHDGSTPITFQLRLERSRARLALGRAQEALEDASAAFELDRSNAVAAEQLGLSALAAREPARALEGFRAALQAGARNAADARTRARLYRGIGQAEESRTRMDLALDAYHRALELDPGEPVARARLVEIERLAASHPGAFVDDLR